MVFYYLVHFLCCIYDHFLSFVRVHVSNFSKMLLLWHQVSHSEVSAHTEKAVPELHVLPEGCPTAEAMVKRWSGFWFHTSTRDHCCPQHHLQPTNTRAHHPATVPQATWIHGCLEFWVEQSLWRHVHQFQTADNFSASSERLLKMLNFQPSFKLLTFLN